MKYPHIEYLHLPDEEIEDYRRSMNIELIGKSLVISKDKASARKRQECIKPPPRDFDLITHSVTPHVRCKEISTWRYNAKQRQEILIGHVNNEFTNIVIEVENSHFNKILTHSAGRIYAGGTSTKTTHKIIDEAFLGRLQEQLTANNVPKVTKVRDKEVQDAWVEIPPCYLVFSHFMLQNDILNVPGFKHATVLSNDPLSDYYWTSSCEIGIWEQLRFLCIRNLCLSEGAELNDRPAKSRLVRSSDGRVLVYPIIAAGPNGWSLLPYRNVDPDLVNIEAKDRFLFSTLKLEHYSAAIIDDPMRFVVGEACATKL